jgi:hypothetical protein
MTTVIVPLRFGAASKYEADIFPVSYHDAPDAISKGSLLLSATLDEMIKMGEMGIDLDADKRFHFNARAQYEASANVNFLPIDLLMYRQSSSKGGEIAQSPKFFQSIHNVPSLSSSADVPCCD